MKRWYPRMTRARARAGYDTTRSAPSRNGRGTPRQQVGFEQRERRQVGVASRPDHHVPRRQLRLDLAPPDLSETPPQTIARHGGLLEPGNHDSSPQMARRRIYPVNVEPRAAATPAIGQHPAEVGTVAQPARATEPLGAGQTRACFEAMVTVRRFRPFFRRRDSTARPQRSAIRFRNPCRAIRRLFRGRYVGIMAQHSFQTSRASYRIRAPVVKV